MRASSLVRLDKFRNIPTLSGKGCGLGHRCPVACGPIAQSSLHTSSETARDPRQRATTASAVRSSSRDRRPTRACASSRSSAETGLERRSTTHRMPDSDCCRGDSRRGLHCSDNRERYGYLDRHPGDLDRDRGEGCRRSLLPRRSDTGRLVRLRHGLDRLPIVHAACALVTTLATRPGIHDRLSFPPRLSTCSYLDVPHATTAASFSAPRYNERARRTRPGIRDTPVRPCGCSATGCRAGS